MAERDQNNGRGGAGNRVRDREEQDDNGDDGRNVRHNPGPPRPDWAIARVPLTSANLTVKLSPMAGVRQVQRLDPNSRIISVETLLDDGPGMRTVVVCMIMSINTPSASDRTQVQQRYNNNRGQSTAVKPYGRRITLMCINSRSGRNMIMMFHGVGHNKRLLDQDPSLRDNGDLRPGALVALVNAPFTDQFLANGSTAILTLSRPLLLLKDNFQYPERPIEANGTDVNGCILHRATVEIETMEVHESGCNGQMCDQQSLMNGGVMLARCACMQMNKTEKIVFCLGLKVTLENGMVFRTQFISKHFMRTYIWNGELPVGIKATNFESYQVENRVFESIQRVTSYINRHGRFMIFLWVKRGEVEDQGVDQPNNGLPYNAARTTVESATLNHHIVRLDPMTPEAIDVEQLNELKFDVRNGFEV